MGESAFTYQVRSFAPVCVAAITRIGAPLTKAPNVLNVPIPVPISALPEITACWVSPAPWLYKISSTSPCFLKKLAFCPSSEKEFSHVPASPPAMRNLSCATAAQLKSTRSTNAAIPSLRLSLIISRPPRDAAKQFDQLNQREFTENSDPDGRLWIKTLHSCRQQWRLFANNVRDLLCNH